MTPGFTLLSQVPAIVQLATSLCGVPHTCCDRLTTALTGKRVFNLSSALYGVENNKYWSSTAVLTPGCIFVPESPFEVSTAVQVLVENYCDFAVRGGGHTTNPGWAGTDSGVLISLSKLNNIEISEDKTAVVVGAGNRWGDVYAKTGEHGITVMGGRLSTVGVSGFLLGGGLSYLMHAEGFGANSVLSYEIVLADGAVTLVTEESAEDLFKALKGGTSNFGIVTSFKLRAYRVNDVYAGHLTYLPDQYGELFPIMESYARNGIESDPKTHVISFFVCVPSQAVNVASFYSFYSEPVAVPPPAIKPFFDVPTIVNTVKIKTIKEAADELGAGTESELPIQYDLRDYSIRADAKLYKQLFEIWNSTIFELASIAGWSSGIVYQPISNSMIRASDKKGGNVLGLEPANDPLIVISYLFAWMSPDDDKQVYAAIDELIATSTETAKSQGRLDQFIYLNYASANQQPIESYGPAQVEFLRKVKAKYDPNSVFEKLSRGGFKIPS